MKKLMMGVLIGFISHMLYLDAILIRQHQIIDKCPLDENPDKDGNLTCLKYGNGTPNRFYGKYFGIYALIKWDNVVTGPWRPE